MTEARNFLQDRRLPRSPAVSRILLDVEDEGVTYLNRILPIDPTYDDLMDLLPCGKPRPPHDFDQDVITEESPLNQWLLDGSST